ncbi:MAG: hypothetical protein M0C28_36150 [Candidatus Moduliflexus flocculans]|nr:hypothetical protein [Candidatus Moduliflexus flocculans]
MTRLPWKWRVRFCQLVEMFNDPYEMAKGCDALMVVTEWNEFKQLDLEKVKSLLKSPVIYDGRNIYDPKVMKEMGFTYRAIGDSRSVVSISSDSRVKYPLSDF